MDRNIKFGSINPVQALPPRDPTWSVALASYIALCVKLGMSVDEAIREYAFKFGPLTFSCPLPGSTASFMMKPPCLEWYKCLLPEPIIRMDMDTYSALICGIIQSPEFIDLCQSCPGTGTIGYLQFPDGNTAFTANVVGNGDFTMTPEDCRALSEVTAYAVNGLARIAKRVALACIEDGRVKPERLDYMRRAMTAEQHQRTLRLIQDCSDPEEAREILERAIERADYSGVS